MKLDAIIRNAGFRLERQRKHKIYKHAELGKTLVVASTPSDHRAEANTLSQLSRLTGIRKRDLIAAPIRKRRLKDAERKYLKRMQKHEIERQMKLGRQRQRLQTVVERCHEFFTREMFQSGVVLSEDTREELHDLAALSLYFRVKVKMGFHDVELMAAEVIINQRVGDIMVVRVGCWYLDYFQGTVHDSPEWIAKLDELAAPVSVFGVLRVVTEDDGITISD